MREMSEGRRLIERYRSPASSSVPSKLSALMELERLRTSDAVAFLLQVLADTREPAEVRRQIVSWLRDGDVPQAFRSRAADTLLDALRDDLSSDVRLQAAQALAEFADLEAVLPTLGAVALDRDESPDLRYSAFISLQSTGPSEACVEVLNRLSQDDLLGPSAEKLLKLWRV